MADDVPQIREPSRPDSDEYKRALAEYLDAGLNFRTHADIRFKQLALYTTLTAVLMAGYMSGKVDPTHKAWLAVLGILMTGVFWFLENRTTKYRRQYIARAIELQPILGFSQYKHYGWGWKTTQFALNLLFGSIATFWLATIILFAALM